LRHEFEAIDIEETGMTTNTVATANVASHALALPDEATRNNRWLQLCFAIICMAMASNIQYGWTLFVNSISAKTGWPLVSIQVAFTILIVSQVALMPIQGYLVDRFGPRPVVMCAGVFLGCAWMLNGMATSLPVLYLAAALGGLGVGGVVSVGTGNTLKWFPDRRGLAVGLSAMGFGVGSAVFINPMADMIKAQGYESTFITFGLIFGLSIFSLAWFMRSPPKGHRVHGAGHAVKERRSYTPLEMVKTVPFWMLYVSFICVAAGGLMVIAQIAPMAKDMKIADVPVTMLGLTMPALVFAMTIDRVLNGVTRPFFGWISDHIGRESAMFAAFALEAIGIWALAAFGHDPLVFVLLSGFVFFAWGEIFSLFPATIGDTFGSKYSATNAMLLQTAQGLGALLVPLSAIIMKATGSWQTVFIIAAGMNVAAALLSLALRPIRKRFMAQN
jgi:OFA family oxalate/formate antiporter-like MFS transporter